MRHISPDGSGNQSVINMFVHGYTSYSYIRLRVGYI